MNGKISKIVLSQCIAVNYGYSVTMATDMNLGTELERNTISGSMEKLQFMKRRTKTGHVGFRFLFNVNACVCC